MGTKNLWGKKNECGSGSLGHTCYCSVCVRARVLCVYVCVSQSVSQCAAGLPAREGSRELCWELHGAQFFKMSSLEQRLSRIEEKLKQENEEARRRIDLNIDMSPQRSRPRPSECPLGRTGVSVTARIAGGKIGAAGPESGGRGEERSGVKESRLLCCCYLHANRLAT